MAESSSASIACTRECASRSVDATDDLNLRFCVTGSRGSSTWQIHEIEPSLFVVAGLCPSCHHLRCCIASLKAVLDPYAVSTLYRTGRSCLKDPSAAENQPLTWYFNLQPQRDSNPCLHRERVRKALRWVASCGFEQVAVGGALRPERPIPSSWPELSSKMSSEIASRANSYCGEP